MREPRGSPADTRAGRVLAPCPRAPALCPYGGEQLSPARAGPEPAAPDLMAAPEPPAEPPVAAEAGAPPAAAATGSSPQPGGLGSPSGPAGAAPEDTGGPGTRQGLQVAPAEPPSELPAPGTPLEEEEEAAEIPWEADADGEGIPWEMDADQEAIPWEVDEDGEGIPWEVDPDGAGILLDVDAEADFPWEVAADAAGIPWEVATAGAGIPWEVAADGAGSLLEAGAVEAPAGAAGSGQPCPSLAELGDHFQECIEAVARLERERDELIRELSRLREPALQEIRRAHEEILAAHRLLAKAELERDNLRDEMGQVKRQLFKVTRECVACEYRLQSQRHELGQAAAARGELEARAGQLGEELARLRERCGKEAEEARQRLEAPPERRDAPFLRESRRLSASLESLVARSRRGLEEHYEPRLLRLLERREAGAAALRGLHAELHALHDALRPLQAEASRLRRRNRGLEEQMGLAKQKRDAEVQQYREQVEELEERLKELRNGVQLQQRKNRELQELRSSLHQELSMYKGCLEIYGHLCKSEERAEQDSEE
ncbi:syncoilin [Eudromia elegans]